ncbi:MAG: DUF389 domain-containing protein [Holophagae bacterium]|jgi:uncharacterized hydrophobic protein (TIGR00271 family)
MNEKSLGVFVGPDLDLSDQLRWAVRLAKARRLDLVVLQRSASQERQTVEVALDGTADGAAAEPAREVLEAMESMPFLRPGLRPEPGDGGEPSVDDEAIYVRLRLVRSPDVQSLRELLLDEIRDSGLELCTIVRRELGRSDPEIVRERREFLRFAPCEVVYCSGFGEHSEIANILVAVASGGHAQAALCLARDLARASGASLTALRVNPEIGPDAEWVGARRLDRLLRKALGKEREGVIHRVVVDDQVARGVRRVSEEGTYDLVVTGASRAGIFGSAVEGSIGARLARDDSGPPIAIVSAASPIKNRLVGIAEKAITRLVPQIDREQRVALVDRVQSSSNWNFDFLALMVLSTFIAAIGLIQDSAAVVIGAMLVAPLMTPLLGLGLSLVQGNPVLAQISIRAVVYGVLVALAVALGVGLLTPGFDEPTREMLGRGGPGLLDLFVAFASGLAAAYASSRPGLLAALPGVAIAAALVPPLATSGLALSLGNLDLAINALLLFAINMVTIVLATVISLWFVGLRGIKKISRWRVRAGAAMLAAILTLGVYLSIKPKTGPVPSDMPEGLMTTIQEHLGDDYDLADVSIAYDELGTQLVVVVAGQGFAPEELVQRVRAAAREHFNKTVRVRLLTKARDDGGSRGRVSEVLSVPTP